MYKQILILSLFLLRTGRTETVRNTWSYKNWAAQKSHLERELHLQAGLEPGLCSSPVGCKSALEFTCSSRLSPVFCGINRPVATCVVLPERSCCRGIVLELGQCLQYITRALSLMQQQRTSLGDLRGLFHLVVL